MTEDLLLVYIFTISIELMLGLVLAISLLLIIAPLRGDDERDINPMKDREAPPRRDLPRTPSEALRASFKSLTRGEDDLPTLLHTQRVLVEYLDSRDRDATA